MISAWIAWAVAPLVVRGFLSLVEVVGGGWECRSGGLSSLHQGHASKLPVTALALGELLTMPSGRLRKGDRKTFLAAGWVQLPDNQPRLLESVRRGYPALARWL